MRLLLVHTHYTPVKQIVKVLMLLTKYKIKTYIILIYLYKYLYIIYYMPCLQKVIRFFIEILIKRKLLTTWEGFEKDCFLKLIQKLIYFLIHKFTLNKYG